MKVLEINLSDIEQNENSRVIYKSTDLAELMASMRKDGLLQAIGVREIKKGKYDAVFGNRRILAAKRLGWKTITANVVEADSDNDRDILNLIENLKRQNTTVSEDGRIFQKLKDGGLSVKEIVARLGVNEQRVTTALDVFNEFPEEFKGIIVNKTGGQKKGGKIAASTAFTVNTIRKNHNLNREQTRTLLKHSMQDGINNAQLNSLAPLLKSGMELQKAIGTVNKIETITLTVSLDREYVAKVEKKTKKKIHEICYEILEDSGYKISRAIGNSNQSPMSTRFRLNRETDKRQ